MAKLTVNVAGCRILAVDDTPANLEVLIEVLEGEGLDIAVATDGEKALELAGNSRPDLILLFLREHVNKSVDGPGRSRRVQSAEHKVPGFCSSHGRLNGLEVPHFTDENHVGIHSQCTPQRFTEIGNVHADFALVDDGFLVRVVILYRVFDRDDMPVDFLIDEIDHGCKCCRFAGRLMMAPLMLQ